MWLIFAAEYDRSAEWVYRGLSRRGLGPIHYLRPHDLLNGARIVHHLSSEGASFSISMRDGLSVQSSSIRGVFNRLQCIPCEELPAWDRQTHVAPSEELQALLFSCLSSLEVPVLPGPHWGERLPGILSRHQWVDLARCADLPVPPKLDGAASSCSALVLFDDFFSTDVPDAFRPACVRLAQLAETPLVQVEFAGGPGELVFNGVSSCPDLRPRGTPFLNALACIFERVASRSAQAGSGSGGV